MVYFAIFLYRQNAIEFYDKWVPSARHVHIVDMQNYFSYQWHSLRYIQQFYNNFYQIFYDICVFENASMESVS